MHVLLIEDEKSILRFLEIELNFAGYTTDQAMDGCTGLDLALAQDYDVILLDIMLPGLDGFEVLEELRRYKTTPVILLTARDAVMDKVRGLDMGANDYIVKPFHAAELLARIRAIFRDTKDGANDSILTVADILCDLDAYTIARDGRQIKFTKKEYDLLCYFMRNHDIVLTRERLLNEVWGYDFYGDSNVVDVYVRYVRNKLNKGFTHKHIETIRGVGYVLKGETDFEEK